MVGKMHFDDMVIPKKRSPLFKDLSGTRRGRITLTKYVGYRGSKSGKKFYYEYKCDCGNTGLTRKDAKNSMSCGCLTAEINKTRNTGKRAPNSLTQPEQVRMAAAKNVFGFYKKDTDITFKEFLTLSQLPCYYCGREGVSKYHIAIRKDMKVRATKKRRDANGNEYETVVWASTMGSEEAFFIYNGLDRIDQTIGHNKNNVVTCCVDCNMMKRNWHHDKFINHIKKVHSWIIKNN
jgi:hypothetical protein